MIFLCAFLAFQTPSMSPDLREVLSRVSEEAEVFAQNMPKALTREVLEQRTLLPASRFRPRAGQSATLAPTPTRLVVRQIVSEYTVGRLGAAGSANLTELRQVVSVDGRKVQTVERAVHSLSLGVKSPDDRVRKRMLEDFARHGLVDIATDYGLILLAFTPRGIGKMRISPAGEAQIGADTAWVFAWEQVSSDNGMLEFLGNQAMRIALKGNLYARKRDSLPLRIETFTDYPNLDPGRHQKVREEASVDYLQSPHGFLTPASVIHRHLVDGLMVTENLYRYDPFKLFTADAAIKFTELDSPDVTTPKK